ncbi:MAG TPA: amidohydrolase family protein [Ktedonobacteraceae bacterium]|nr:amidohydrolase family protein [Ktedonobacteraceae bacterium]
MIIDMHCHLAPPKWAESKPLPPLLTDIDGFFQRREQAGVTFSVISNPMMNVPGTQQNDTTRDKIREYEDFAASVIASHPGRVSAFLGVNPLGGNEILYEAERAVKQNGFKGITINSNVDGEYLDTPKADDFWALIAELDVPVFVHPPALPCGYQGIHDFRLVEHAGRPCDVALGLAAIIFSGVLERYPSLVIIGGMAGGGLAMLPGRLDMGYRYAHWQGGPAQGQSRARGGAGAPPFVPQSVGQAPDRISQEPSNFVRQIYVDSCTYSVPAMQCNLAVYGSQHIIFGSDSPPVNLPLEASVRLIQSLPLTVEEQENILWRNAARILKLEEYSHVQNANHQS